jgi:hypothetical protein
VSKLSAWDLADDFTAREVSLLAIGVDPDSTMNNATPLLGKMLKSFKKAIPWYEKIINGIPEGEGEYCADMLVNVQMLVEINYTREGYCVDFLESPEHISFESERPVIPS